MKAIAVGSMLPKAAGSGERIYLKATDVGSMRPKAAGSGERTSLDRSVAFWTSAKSDPKWHQIRLERSYKWSSTRFGTRSITVHHICE